ncbi:MAG TPA: zf-HC2 domain-containing protein [Blastocatellia bacterium]
MKCEEILSMREEYFDGELGEKDSQLVTAHLAACGACAVEYDRLCREQEFYASYEREVDVTPALWSGVQARIREEKATRQTGKLRQWMDILFGAPRLSFVATAALVVIAIGATVLVMSYMNSRNQPSGASIEKKTADNKQPPNLTPQGGTNDGQPNDAASQNVTPPVPDKDDVQPTPASKSPRKEAVRKPTPEQLVREAEQKYVAAIALLSKEVNRRRTEIDPMVLARFDSALAAIDRTIEDTRRAVRQSPNDPIALQYMLAAYAKKVDVLREMAND